jgi:hypothetical protein
MVTSSVPRILATQDDEPYLGFVIVCYRPAALGRPNLTERAPEGGKSMYILPCRRYRPLTLVALLLALTLPNLLSPTSTLAAVEYNLQVPFSDDFDSCSGERVVVSGTTHIVSRVTKDSTGGLHYGFTGNTQGATGVGVVSGAKYVMTSLQTISQTFAVMPGEATVLNLQHSERLIRTGSALPDDDTIVHFLVCTTINANGEVTASIDSISAECR